MQEERKKIAGRATSRKETINKRFKQWEILRATFRHDLLHHRDFFVAIVCITQVAIENGEPLFDCDEYEYYVYLYLIGWLDGYK
jgi:phage terminase large subunit-like protein